MLFFHIFFVLFDFYCYHILFINITYIFSGVYYWLGIYLIYLKLNMYLTNKGLSDLFKFLEDNILFVGAFYCATFTQYLRVAFLPEKKHK